LGDKKVGTISDEKADTNAAKPHQYPTSLIFMSMVTCKLEQEFSFMAEACDIQNMSMKAMSIRPWHRSFLKMLLFPSKKAF